MEVIGNGPIRVLVVPPYYERTLENLFRTMSRTFKSRITVYSLGVHNLPRRQNSGINYKSLLEKCRSVIRKENITVLYADKRVACFLLAVLREEFPQLRGPSVESVFVCSHSLYRKLIDAPGGATSLPYITVNVSEDIYDTAQNILQTFGCPGVLKLGLQLGRYLNVVYRNRDRLIQGLAYCKKCLDVELDDLKELLEEHIDLSKYPMATEPIVLVERLEDVNLVTDGNYWLRIEIDACVNNGEFVLWGMTDYVKSPYRDKASPQIFLGKQMPSEIILKTSQMQKLWRKFEADVKELMKFGFNNSMVRGQYKIYDNGDIRQTFLTVGLKPDGAELYIRHMGEFADTRVAAINVASGQKKRITSPIPTSTFAMLHILTTPLSGKFSALADYDKCIENKDVALRYAKDENIIFCEELLGAKQFGSICVTGNHFGDCLEKLVRIRKDILLIPELVCVETDEASQM